MTNVMWFESYWEGMKPEVGGKAASLGEMTGAGLPVPPGFALTTEAFRTCRDAAELDTSLARLLYGLDVNNMAMVSERCGSIRDVIRTMPMDPEVEKSLRHRVLRAEPPIGDGGRSRGGPLVRHERGLPGRLLRRRARHVPVDPGRGPGGGCRSALLGEPVHGPGDLLPRRDGLRPPLGGDERGRAEDGAAHRGRRRLHPEPGERGPVGGRDRCGLGLRRGRRLRGDHAGQLPRRQGPVRDQPSRGLEQGARVPAHRPRLGREGRGRCRSAPRHRA